MRYDYKCVGGVSEGCLYLCCAGNDENCVNGTQTFYGCGEIVEVMHGMKETPTISCPECGMPMTRQLALPSVVYHGTGYHSTDYRKGPRTNAEAQH